MSPVFDARWVSDQLHTAGMRGVQAAAKAVLAQSQRVAPRDTGDLVESGYVGRDGDAVVIGYTDPKAVGAHENLRDHHSGARRAKFLEQPLLADQDAIARETAEAIRRETA